MWSQVGLRKHHYEQTQWRWRNSSWAVSNPERWCCESAALNMPANLETQQWTQDWKRSVFIPIPKKGNTKECSNYHTTALISHASKVMLKILQASLQQSVNHELPDFQAGFRKGRGTRDQCRNNFRTNEEMEPKQQQHPVVDVTVDGSKVLCCKKAVLHRNLEC